MLTFLLENTLYADCTYLRVVNDKEKKVILILLFHEWSKRANLRSIDAGKDQHSRCKISD